jgi:lipid-A-disaccharide synthase
MKVLIVAAEASSGLFAQRLLEHWKNNAVAVDAYGVGTKAMEQLGFKRLGEAEKMAVVGIAEVVEAYSYLKSVFDSIVEQTKLQKPKFILLLDAPDFNLRLAEKLHPLGIPIIYYVSPQVWAWRVGRVEKIKKFCTKMFVIFPFEKEFYQQHGVAVDFVGHPLLDEINEKYFDKQYVQMQRQRRGISSDDIVIGIMPGSRRSEIGLHFKLQLQVARELVRARKNIKILIMVAPTIEKEALEEQMGEVDFPIITIKDEPFEMIALADFVLAASGTATLMVGLLHKPMVIMYRLKWLTYALALVVARHITFFGIVNLIFKTEIVPERLQHHANVNELKRLMLKYIDDPAYSQSVREKLAQLKYQLGDKGATVRVAEKLKEFFL